MKTKKLLFLFAITMVFSFSTVAQNVRGGCTSSKAYYNYENNSWPNDSDPTSNSTTIEIPTNTTEFKCGVESPRQHEGQSWSFEVFKNGTSVSFDNTFAGNDYTVINPTPNNGDTCTIVLTMTPNTTNGCSGSTWTYTWNLTGATCPATSVTPFYNVSGTGWVGNKTDIEISISDNIQFGPQPGNGGSWFWETTSQDASISDPNIREPEFTGFEEGNHTVTAIYTNDCGAETITVFNVIASTTCPATSVQPFYNISGSGWVGDETNIVMSVTDNILFGPKPNSGGSWFWETTSQDASISDANIREPEFAGFAEGNYTITSTYTNPCGTDTVTVFNVTIVECVATNSNLYYNINGVDWVNGDTNVYEIDLYDVPASEINIGVDPKPVITWNGCGITDQVSNNSNFTFTPTFDGNGDCTIQGVYTNNCGDEITYTFNLHNNTLGIDKFEQAGFKMYPNPATNKLNLNFNGDLEVSILNISGQKLMQNSINGQKIIDISHLSNGIYFVRLSANNDVIIRKLIKK